MTRGTILFLALAFSSLACSTGSPRQGSASSAHASAALPVADTGEATASAECAFAETYRFKWSGGMTLFDDSYTLEPPNRFTMRREYNMIDRSAEECSGTLRACEADDVLTVADVSARLTDSLVRRIWPDSGQHLVGQDLRPVDAPILAVTRESGGRLLIGAPCREGASCEPVPEEVAALQAMLQRLAREIDGAAACEHVGR